MACSKFTSDQLGNEVVSVVQQFNPGHQVSATTSFSADLGENAPLAPKYFKLIQQTVTQAGCQFHGNVGAFSNCATVQDMIDLTVAATSC